MNLDKKYILPIICGILAVFLLIGTYFSIVHKKISENRTIKNTLQSDQLLLNTIEAKIKAKNENKESDTFNLQKRIPVKASTEQLIIDMERAENISESSVISMVFQENPSESNDSETGKLQKDFEDSINLEGNGSEEETETENEPLIMPVGMNELTVNLEVESKDYFTLEKFIRELENNERIILIKNIKFTGVEEQVASDSLADSKLSPFQLTLSVFYMPNLMDLQENVPTLEIPESSNKVNPFHP